MIIGQTWFDLWFLPYPKDDKIFLRKISFTFVGEDEGVGEENSRILHAYTDFYFELPHWICSASKWRQKLYILSCYFHFAYNCVGNQPVCTFCLKDLNQYFVVSCWMKMGKIGGCVVKNKLISDLICYNWLLTSWKDQKLVGGRNL